MALIDLGIDSTLNQWWVLNHLYLPICPYDSVSTMDTEESSSVPSEPIEGGNLASYNKVNEGTVVNLTLNFDGNYPNQIGSLALLDLMKTGTKKCLIISPNRIYRNMALTRYAYSRSAGAGGHLLAVDCTFQEIISVNLVQQSVKSSYSGKNATSASTVDMGKVQTQGIGNSFALDSGKALVKGASSLLGI